MRMTGFAIALALGGCGGIGSNADPMSSEDGIEQGINPLLIRSHAGRGNDQTNDAVSFSGLTVEDEAGHVNAADGSSRNLEDVAQ